MCSITSMLKSIRSWRICFLLLVSFSLFNIFYGKAADSVSHRIERRIRGIGSTRSTRHHHLKSSLTKESLHGLSDEKLSIIGQRHKNSGNPSLCFFVAWLYFMAVSLNIPNLPSYVNYVVSKGGSTVTSKGASVYGMLSGIDSFFTFLSVNAVGCLSDTFGRKPFICYSSLGLGLAYFLASTAKFPWVFYIASTIDGLSSW